MHLAQHLFGDIVAKGVTRNYSSKTFEKMHGPLKESYVRRTNFKDVGSQVTDWYLTHLLWKLIYYCKILKAEHRAFVSAFIRSQIDQLETYQSDFEDDLGGGIENITNTAPHITPLTSTFRSGDHFTLGSYQRKLTIKELLEREVDNIAFASFCTRVSVAIKNLDPVDAIAIDESHQVCYSYSSHNS